MGKRDVIPRVKHHDTITSVPDADGTYRFLAERVPDGPSVQRHAAVLLQALLHALHPAQHLVQPVLHAQRARQHALELLVPVAHAVGQVAVPLRDVGWTRGDEGTRGLSVNSAGENTVCR